MGARSASALAALAVALLSVIVEPAAGYPAAAFPAEDGSTYLASLMGEAGTEAPDTAADRTASVDVEFHVYTRLNPVNPEVVAANSTLPHLDPTAELVVLVHGFTGSVTSQSVILIRDALLYMQNITVVAVQWARLARGPWYDEAAANTWSVARHLSQFLLNLEGRGLDVDKVHIIGFSLGAHVAGFAGAFMEGRIGRITGLDPARPGFDVRNSSGRLDPSDAKFVMGLHTGAGFVALSEPVGHADFYPNGGSKQPHCEKTEEIPLVCNHFMAYTYYAESIYNHEAFPSRKCSSWADFSSGLCDANDVMPMGYFTQNSSRGLYFLRTNAQEPYGIAQVDHKVDLNIGQSESSTTPSVDTAGNQKDINNSSTSCGHHRDVYCVDNGLDNSGAVDIQPLNDLSSHSCSCKLNDGLKYVLLVLLLLLS